MNKRSRFIIILMVLALCFVFLWPSLKWYALIPQEDKDIALSSLEKIRDYSHKQAVAECEELLAIVSSDARVTPTESQRYLLRQAKRNARQAGARLAADASLKEIMETFADRGELVAFIEGKYRKKILSDKNCYNNSVKLGLDLSGGMNIIVKADLDAALATKPEDSVESDEQYKQRAMQQAIETLTGSIDTFGLSEPVIRQQGDDRIYIEMPGSVEADSINSIIQGKGILNFRLVDEDATNEFMARYRQDIDSAFSADGTLKDPSVVPPDSELLGMYGKDRYGLDVLEGYIVVKKEIALDGNHIKSAEVRNDPVKGTLEVDFTLDGEGAEIFGDFTTSHEGERMAIVDNGRVKSAPKINNAITGGRVSITGGFNRAEADNLQKVLQTAWLSVPLRVESQQAIGAALGAETIRRGLLALVVGLAAVMVFMIVYYKGAGFNAVVAQVLNLYMMFCILSAFNFTLSLSSFAGMILTIGMAVDANVVIFERIKEELRLGKSRASAIAAGFDNAFWAIMDSNITTFIAAIFLSQLGTGTIQGFAVSLAIGVVSSVFTALVVSRLMFDFNTEVVHKKNMSIGWGIK